MLRGVFNESGSEPLLLSFRHRPLVDREEALVQRVRELAGRQVAHLAEHALLVHLVRLIFMFTIVSGIEVADADRVRVLDCTRRDASRVLLLALALLVRGRALHVLETGSESITS